MRYRADIDGLRAVAILSVVGYHADLALFGGGFVGVDVFFVISGYLITSIIHHDIALGRFTFARFYERRIRRIFPALFAMSFFCVLAAAVILIPTDFEQFGRSLVAMALFVSNFFFRQDVPAGYFGIQSATQLLIHTWSLAVEEQFYILLPPALLFLNRHAGRHVVKTLLAGILLSFVVSIVMVRYEPSAAFYLIGPRAWELLIGGLLAIKRFPPPETRAPREATTGVGLVLILFAILRLSKDTPFPGWNALFPCLGTWLIIYAGAGGTSFVTASLSLRPVVFIGKISYSLYLWHWPVLVVTKYLSLGHLTFLETSSALVISVLAAVISYKYVETPFRRRRPAMTRSRLFAGAGAATLLFIVTGCAIIAGKGFPQRFDSRTRYLIAENLAREGDFVDLEDCDHYQTDIHSLTVKAIKYCQIDPSSGKKILFWGDSHMANLYPLVQDLGKEGELDGHGAVFAINSGCPPSSTMDRRAPRLHCDVVSKLALERAKASDIDTVFIDFTGWWTSRDGTLCNVEAGTCDPMTRDEAQGRLVAELAGYARALRRAGKRVIFALSDPTYEFGIPRLEILKATLPRANLAKPPKRFDFTQLRDRIAAVASATGAATFDSRKSLCQDEACVYQKDGVSIYRDDNHIAKSQLGLLRDNLRDTLSAALTSRKPGRDAGQ